MTTRIVLLDDYQDVGRDLCPVDQLDDVEVVAVTEHLTGEDLVAALSGAAVVVCMRERTRFDRALFDRLGDLKLLVTTGPANAAIDLDAATATGVMVCASTGAASNNTTELAWGLILAVLRHLPTEVDNVRSGRWQSTVGTDLEGLTLGLVGLGRIGSRMASIGQAFGMDVIAWSQNLDADKASRVGVRAVAKEELFATADVVSIHLMLSERSRGTVGEAELRAMKRSAVLINTSRGPIVDEDALVVALREGRIAGAGIDVYGEEPLPADAPIRSVGSAVLTPHIGYVTRATLAGWYADAMEDVAAWQRGAPIRVLNG